MIVNKEDLFSKYLVVVILVIVILFSCSTDTRTVRDVMDEKITALYKTKTEDELLSLTNEQSLSLFSEADLKFLPRGIGYSM
jgi:uncharacterized membrane protein